jgi:transposase
MGQPEERALSRTLTQTLRALTAEERAKIARLSRAQSAPVRLVRRAQIIQLTAQGLAVPAMARQLGISEKAVRQRIARFAAAGMAGLEDAPRAGRPRAYDEQTYSRVIAKARSLPPQPDVGEVPPTCHWTLDRLQAELAKEGLPIQRSQIRRILQAAHIKWQKPRTWLASADPQFAAKRGQSSRATPIHLLAAR